jgi:hypothetical protein
MIMVPDSQYYVDNVIVKRASYHAKTVGIYKRHRLGQAVDHDVADQVIAPLQKTLPG